ncbi:MAG: GNAT family N-acetyltransferase [Cyclobacteriaceae bacterium]|nr:GNAT family N-acetyltransferase [Cyclobacteriaceae bacterium]
MNEIRSLFTEYASGLGISLCFQDFDNELKGLPGDYREPGGLLLLAKVDQLSAGCCALRPLKVKGHGHAAEMKRLYVRPAFRGKAIGLQLVNAILKGAASAGYSAVLLDTLGTMGEAQSLYQRLGFVEIPAYYDNPIKGAKYLKLDLTQTP